MSLLGGIGGRLYRGEVSVESGVLSPARGAPMRVALAPAPVSRRDPFLFHKTTRRAVYDAARQGRPGFEDVLLHNEEGELTELTIGNLVLELDGRRVTPRRESGLLAGTFRAELLERGDVEERTLTLPDLERGRRCWLVNSVREWVPMTVEASGTGGPS